MTSSHEFKDRAEAIAHAKILAADLARDGANPGTILVVIDEDGHVVAEVPVRPLDS